MIMAPYVNIDIIVNSVDVSTDFNYKLLTYDSRYAQVQDEQDLSILTENGIGSSSLYTSVWSATGTIYINQSTSSDWQLSSSTCTSTNPNSITVPYGNGVKITAYPFTDMVCTFTNTKVVPILKKNPVIIIPGILASYLNRNDDEKTEVWMNLTKALRIGNDSYLDELSLDLLGLPDMSYPIMLPVDIFRKIEVSSFGNKIFFDGLIKQMEDSGYIENTDLFVFPYDWRLNIVNSASDVYTPMLTSLKDKVDQVLVKTGAEKVDIVAHSMGGLLTKYYIKHFGEGKVDKFIDIATPHLGAPNTFSTLMSGDNLGIKFGWFGLNPAEIKKISQNMASVYQLLPSANYFDNSDKDYSYYIDDMDDYDSDGVKGRLSFEQSNNFLKNTGRNELLLDTAPNIHTDLDTMNPADYGVKAYNIVGCGTPTMGKFFSLGKQNNNDPEFDIAYINGDGTVPIRSAESLPALERYYVKNANHPLMPSTPGVKELVTSILGDEQQYFDLSIHPNIIGETADCKLPNGTFLSFHSPVAVNIFDAEGNHTGPNDEGELEENIPDITYDIFENNKFVFLPDGVDYQVKLTAMDIGSFSSHIKKMVDGEIISTSYFNDIKLASLDTKALVDYSISEPTITLDSVGDGINTETINPASVMAGDSLNDRTAPVTNLVIIFPATTTEDGFYEGEISFTFEAADTDSGILKIEYSLDNEFSYLEATSTIIISEIGTSTIFYRSIDKAGNIENIKQFDLVITPVPVDETVVDDVSTTTSSTTVVLISEPEIIAPIVQPRSFGSYSSTVVIVPTATENITLTEAVLPIETILINEPVIVIPTVVAVPPVNKVKSRIISMPKPEQLLNIASSSITLSASVVGEKAKINSSIITVIIVILICLLVFINKKYIMK